MYEVGIEDGYVYLEGSFHLLNLYFNGDKIAALTHEKHPCQTQVEARGKNILPGLIDPHVHFALGVGENVSKDDFYTGSIEAASGGITTFIDFLDPVRTKEEVAPQYDKRSNLAKRSIIDYSFHGTVANPIDSASSMVKEFQKFGINSVKLFTTYSESNRRTFDGCIYDLLLASKEQKAVILVHAENDDLINKRKDILIADHEKARPLISETTEVMNLAQMAKDTGGTLYIVHVSAGSSVKLLSENFKTELENHQIFLESCPHYFLLNRDYLSREDGYKFTMTPPLRSEEERKLLHQQYQLITAIGTDHCPYDKEKKFHQFTSEIPMGIGGLRYSFLNMYNEFGFSILDQFTIGPAKAYGLKNKGSLLPGNDADIVIFDSEGQTSVTDDMSVYFGKTLKGKIDAVYSRGDRVFADHKIKEHIGRFIRRGDKYTQPSICL